MKSIPKALIEFRCQKCNYFHDHSWDDIVEEYGIGYHNFYLKDFTQRLGKELEDEKPRSTL